MNRQAQLRLRIDKDVKSDVVKVKDVKMVGLVTSTEEIVG